MTQPPNSTCNEQCLLCSYSQASLSHFWIQITGAFKDFQAQGRYGDNPDPGYNTVFFKLIPISKFMIDRIPNWYACVSLCHSWWDVVFFLLFWWPLPFFMWFYLLLQFNFSIDYSIYIAISSQTIPFMTQRSNFPTKCEKYTFWHAFFISSTNVTFCFISSSFPRLQYHLHIRPG